MFQIINWDLKEEENGILLLIKVIQLVLYYCTVLPPYSTVLTYYCTVLLYYCRVLPPYCTVLPPYCRVLPPYSTVLLYYCAVLLYNTSTTIGTPSNSADSSPIFRICRYTADSKRSIRPSCIYWLRHKFQLKLTSVGNRLNKQADHKLGWEIPDEN
jgi:hypothetical protein